MPQRFFYFSSSLVLLPVAVPPVLGRLLLFPPVFLLCSVGRTEQTSSGNSPVLEPLTTSNRTRVSKAKQGRQAGRQAGNIVFFSLPGVEVRPQTEYVRVVVQQY